MQQRLKGDWATCYKINNHKGQMLFVGNNTTSGCHCHVTENYILNQIYGTKIVYFFEYSSNDDIVSKYKEELNSSEQIFRSRRNQTQRT